MKVRTFVAGIAVLMLAGLAHGALVTFDVVYDPNGDPDPNVGTFTVEATVSPADNAGLAGFSVVFGANVVAGPYDASTNPQGLRNWAPAASMVDATAVPPDFKSVGFSAARAPTAAFPRTLSGGQNSANGPQFLVYGVGQGPANWPVPPGNYQYVLPPTPDPIPAPVLLGSGYYQIASGPEVLSANANVWVADGDDQAAKAETEVNVELIPEPATMGLLSLGFVGILALRRRRRK
jgi:hypothetical protein